jgi:endonuclease G
MKKIFLTFLGALLVSAALSQGYKVDTVISTPIYKSHFNKTLKVPIFVSYTLWKAGGNCSRDGMDFKNDTKIQMATSKDYASSGYDKGHLAPAKDFSSNCTHLEITFRFYNCLPQTPNLNRGNWKKTETDLRRQSATDSLLVICGGIFENSKKMGANVAIPTRCWKLVQNLKTKKVEHIWIFINDNSDALPKEISLKELESILKLKVPIKK